ncbi:haloacid dehalogenase-like hydrolase [Nocardiopsis sediminis]|uniref:phosphoserine phosphatase n=1 Tax=Nocardiopsis sediminis TaxID=1778267 RepID=A0ABV8FQN3_9ACTN
MRTRPLRAAATLAAALAFTAAAPLGAVSAADTLAAEGRCPRLSVGLPWYGDNREDLQRVIDERGRCTDPGGRPVAAFDWDNTVTKNDVTDATLAWALHNDKILRPERWSDVSAWLTPAADRALTDACGTEVPVGEPLPTSTNTRCTDEIFEIRENAATMDGDPAFAGEWDHRRTVPEYAWVPQLFAGHTPDQLASYASAARERALAAPVGSTLTVGTHTIPGYVRYYPQQRDLIRTLHRAGFEVYIVSAGSEPVTRVWSAGVGIDAEHTIAIRSVLDDRGRITVRNEGCGGTPDSQGADIPYIEGKRCWVNQEIFGVEGPAAWERQDPANRIALGSGDADTDVSFVADATDARLVLNRNRDEIMCRAYDDADGRWLINPMFIEPLDRKTDPYPCATAGYTRPDGTLGPVLRDDGSVIPDQQDTVY